MHLIQRFNPDVFGVICTYLTPIDAQRLQLVDSHTFNFVYSRPNLLKQVDSKWLFFNANLLSSYKRLVNKHLPVKIACKTLDTEFDLTENQINLFVKHTRKSSKIEQLVYLLGSWGFPNHLEHSRVHFQNNRKVRFDNLCSKPGLAELLSTLPGRFTITHCKCDRFLTEGAYSRHFKMFQYFGSSRITDFLICKGFYEHCILNYSAKMRVEFMDDFTPEFFFKKAYEYLEECREIINESTGIPHPTNFDLVAEESHCDKTSLKPFTQFIFERILLDDHL